MHPRVAAAWVIFWIGHFIHVVTDNICRGYIPGGYRLYAFLMLLSDDAQGKHPGPWGGPRP